MEKDVLCNFWAVVPCMQQVRCSPLSETGSHFVSNLAQIVREAGSNKLTSCSLKETFVLLFLGFFIFHSEE